jgi:hypothetical protein
MAQFAPLKLPDSITSCQAFSFSRHEDFAFDLEVCRFSNSGFLTVLFYNSCALLYEYAHRMLHTS